MLAPSRERQIKTKAKTKTKTITCRRVEDPELWMEAAESADVFARRLARSAGRMTPTSRCALMADTISCARQKWEGGREGGGGRRSVQQPHRVQQAWRWYTTHMPHLVECIHCVVHHVLHIVQRVHQLLQLLFQQAQCADAGGVVVGTKASSSSNTAARRVCEKKRGGARRWLRLTRLDAGSDQTCSTSVRCGTSHCSCTVHASQSAGTFASLGL